MIDFPSPILSVSADVVKDLDGEDALYGMWTVFTKCKQSLKDGRRLENISWRLWYREMASSHECHSPGSTSPAFTDDRCASPLTPLSEDAPHHANSSNDSLMPVADPSSRHSWHGDDTHPTPPTAVRRLSTASMPVRPRSHPTQRVGSIILGVLPGTLVVPSRPQCSRPQSGTSAPRSAVPALPSHPSTAKPSPITQGLSGPGKMSPGIMQPRPVAALPTLNLPTTPPNAGAPRVVVVNPTPHPTPPATPHPHHSSPAHPMPAPTHLTPPPARVGHAVAVLPPPPQVAAVPVLSKPGGSGADPGSSAAVPRAEMTSATATTSRRGGDETLKPSDKRFFLQSAESPDQDSPERGDPTTSKSPDLPEPSPSSGTSSHIKSEGIQGPRRSFSRAGSRRGKEVPRFTTARSTSKLHTQRTLAAHRRTGAEPKKTTFNIGSVSSNGTKSDSRELKETSSSKQNLAAGKGRQPPVAKGPGGTGRKGLVMSTSSDYSTDSDDDSEWASEDASAEDDKEKERQKEETRLAQAAQEAQRQRDMFAKVDKRSYTALPSRTRSGLLTQLLNPDPTLFPPDHPYRVKSLTDVSRLGRMPTMTSMLTTSKSSATLPLQAQMTPVTAQVSPSNGTGTGYRPKGRPQNQEMEEDSDSDENDENGENGIQLSRSAAQQKLAELARPRRRASDQPPSGLQQQRLQHQRTQQQRSAGQQQQPQASTSRAVLPSIATAPIPLAHPYNLPAPAPPMTPRTTRRQMLSTELSESLRRNLLWERQVSKINMVRNTTRRQGGVLGNNLRPLTAVHDSQTQAGDQVPGDDREERRRAAVARNRSWADDYHYAGW